MEIVQKANLKDGNVTIHYKDCNSFNHIPQNKITQTYGVCFYKNRIVVGQNNVGRWNLIGGTVEAGETILETLKREVLEESNMELMFAKPIGYQHIIETDKYQIRNYCLVKPYGKFVKDPGGSITKIKLINPTDFVKYIKWGEIGSRIIERAIKIHRELTPADKL